MNDDKIEFDPEHLNNCLKEQLIEECLRLKQKNIVLNNILKLITLKIRNDTSFYHLWKDFGAFLDNLYPLYLPGDTSRDDVINSELYIRGDVVNVWINEGDLGFSSNIRNTKKD